MTTQRASQNVQGILWKIAACAAFAVLNAIVHYLTGGAGDKSAPLPAAEIACLQNVVGCVLMVPLMLRGRGLAFFRTQHIAMHTVRILFGAGGIILLYLAFAVMPIAKAVSLGFLGPIFTVIAAYFYLNERLGPWRMFGIILGLVGAFLISRPDAEFMQGELKNIWALGLPLGSAACFALCKIVGRELTLRGDSPALLTVYLLVFMAPVCFVPALPTWVSPTLNQWGWLVLLGGVASFAHYSMAKSFACAEVVYLTPFGFSRLLFSAAIAYVAFGQMPKTHDFWLGTLIVFIGTLAICWEEEKEKKKERAPLPQEALATRA